MYLEERSMITLDNVEIEDSYSALNGGMVYATAINSPTESQITFLNSAKITNV